MGECRFKVSWGCSVIDGRFILDVDYEFKIVFKIIDKRVIVNILVKEINWSDKRY